MKSNSLNCDLPEPVLLNCWKHHAGFIRSKIVEYKKHPETFRGQLQKEILLIGNSLMDLYLGDFTPAEIAASISTYLNLKKVSGRESYRSWLKEEGHTYRVIEIADRSRWTLRLGEKQERYLHIHPSRYSPNTIRVRSSSLKSAILLCILNGKDSPNILGQVNQIRKEYLDLPPLKNILKASALVNLVGILS